jgi:hypothetical protein
MSYIIYVTGRATNTTSDLPDGNTISLTGPSDIRLDIEREDIEALEQRGDDLVVRHRDGTEIVIENFYVGGESELTSRLIVNGDIIAEQEVASGLLASGNLGLAAAGLALAGGGGSGDGGGDGGDGGAANAKENALASIEAYNASNGTGTAPTVETYATAGVIGVTPENVAAVNAQVSAAVTGGANTTAEIQTLANTGQTNAIAALAIITAYAQDGDNGDPANVPSVQDYIDAGVTGVDAANLNATNAAVEAATGEGANTVDEIQTLATTAIALAKIEDYNNGDGTSPAALTVQDYVDAGITGVTSDNLAAVNAQVLAAGPGEANSVGEIQGLVGSEKIVDFWTTDSPTTTTDPVVSNAGRSLTFNSKNEAAGDTASQVVKTTVGQEYEFSFSANSSGVAEPEHRVDVIIKSSTGEVLSQQTVSTVYGDPVDPFFKYTATTENTTIELVNTYTDTDGSDLLLNNLDNRLIPSTLVQDGELGSWALNGNKVVYDDVNKGLTFNISNTSSGGTATQDIATTAGQKYEFTWFADYVGIAGNEGQFISVTIQDSAGNVLATRNSNALPTNWETHVLEYTATDGLTTMTITNGSTGTGLNNDIRAREMYNRPIQTAVEAAADAALVTIEAYNNGDGTSPAALTVADYAAAGVTGVTAGNLAAVNAQVLAAGTGEANSVSEVQALATLVIDAALATIEAYNNGNGTTPAALAVADYEAAGITGVTADNLAVVNAQVLAAATGGADSVSEVQGLVVAAVAVLALAKIEDYNNGNGTSPAALAVQDYVDAGITGVTTDNLAAVNAQVLAAATGGADTVSEVQALATAVTDALAEIAEDVAGDANGTPVSAAQIGAVAKNVDAALEAQYQAALADGTNYEDPASPTAAEVQAVVNVVNAPPATIDLANEALGGQLIHPVEVLINGVERTYYFWDRNGNGEFDYTGDIANHQVLDTLFNGGADTTDAIDDRSYTMSDGTILRLPTVGGATGEYVASPTENQTVLDDYAAIHDAFDGTGNDDVSVYPSGWAFNGLYWTATSLGAGFHDRISVASGTTWKGGDNDTAYVALEVV